MISMAQLRRHEEQSDMTSQNSLTRRRRQNTLVRYEKYCGAREHDDMTLSELILCNSFT